MKGDIAVFYGVIQVNNFIGGIYSTLLAASLARKDEDIVIATHSSSDVQTAPSEEDFRIYTMPLKST